MPLHRSRRLLLLTKCLGFVLLQSRQPKELCRSKAFVRCSMRHSRTAVGSRAPLRHGLWREWVISRTCLVFARPRMGRSGGVEASTAKRSGPYSVGTSRHWAEVTGLGQCSGITLSLAKRGARTHPPAGHGVLRGRPRLCELPRPVGSPGEVHAGVSHGLPRPRSRSHKTPSARNPVWPLSVIRGLESDASGIVQSPLG
jgi:hypothetical protein